MGWTFLGVDLVVGVWLLGTGLVGSQSWVEVKLDGADVEGTDKGGHEEAEVPVAKNIHSFIVFEDIFVLVDVSRLDWVEVASDVSSEVSVEDGGGVESMVVRGSEVNDHREELVSSFVDGLEEGLDLAFFLLVVIFFVAE